MQQDSSQRIVYLDLLRLIATFGVIVLHVYGAGYNSNFKSFNWYIAVVGDSLVRWAVPMFVMISGVLFLNPEKQVTYRSVLTKSLSRLLLAYVFWTFAYGLVHIGDEMIRGNGLMLWYLFHPAFHLWFLPMLMGIYLCVPMIRKISKDWNLMKYALVIWLVYLLVVFVESLWPMYQIGDVFTNNLVVGYLGYFLLGYYLSKIALSKKQIHLIYIFGLIGAVITVLGNILYSFYKGNPNVSFLSELSIHVVTMSMALFLLLRENAHQCGKLLLRFVEYVRKDLFGIYLTHAFWLVLLNNSMIKNYCSHLITLPIISIAIFFLSLFTTKLIRLIPILKKVVE